MLRLYRAAYSTNCQRVTLALAHKELGYGSVWIEYDDRSEVERVSGQGLAPVLDDRGTVVIDSTRILGYLDERFPTPRLFPADPGRRAEVEIFIDWFKMDDALDRLEAMLGDRDFLMSDELSAADVVVYPFVKYAGGKDPVDDELFHLVLDEHQSAAGRPQLAAWIHRVGELPGRELVPSPDRQDGA